MIEFSAAGILNSQYLDHESPNITIGPIANLKNATKIINNDTSLMLIVKLPIGTLVQ